MYLPLRKSIQSNAPAQLISAMVLMIALVGTFNVAGWAQLQGEKDPSKPLAETNVPAIEPSIQLQAVGELPAFNQDHRPTKKAEENVFKINQSELSEPIVRVKIPMHGADGPRLEVTSDSGLLSLFANSASLQSVVAAIARVHELNIVFPEIEDVPITVSLNRVPVEQALDGILSVVGYTWTSQQGVIYITDSTRAASLPPNIQGRVVEVFHLDFAAAADVASGIQGLLSPIGSTAIIQSEASNHLKTKEVVVVEELPRYMDRIAAYVSHIDIPPRQVMIEAHILQVDLDSDERHGVNLEALYHPFGDLSIETTGFANANASQALFAKIEASDFKSLIECIETTTDAKTLASPRLLVVNGQLARIQIGEELGYRVTTTTEMSSQEGVEFLDLGVVLDVTPRIGRTDEILLRVQPKVSSGRINPDTELPEEEVTEVQTDVLLSNGQGMVIGGLIQETDSIIISKVPCLGDMRFIGPLFQRRSSEKKRTEIIVMLLPKIIAPGAAGIPQSEIDKYRDIRLFHGPLQRNSRQWESRLPDPVTEAPAYNPRRSKNHNEAGTQLKNEGESIPTSESVSKTSKSSGTNRQKSLTAPTGTQAVRPHSCFKNGVYERGSNESVRGATRAGRHPAPVITVDQYRRS